MSTNDSAPTPSCPSPTSKEPCAASTVDSLSPVDKILDAGEHTDKFEFKEISAPSSGSSSESSALAPQPENSPQILQKNSRTTEQTKTHAENVLDKAEITPQTEASDAITLKNTAMTSDLHDESMNASTDLVNSSLLATSSERDKDLDGDSAGNQTYLEEKEMRIKLMDMESSFLPEPSTIEIAAMSPDVATNDTYLVGVIAEKSNVLPFQSANSQRSLGKQDTQRDDEQRTPHPDHEDETPLDLNDTQLSITDHEGHSDFMPGAVASTLATATAPGGLHDYSLGATGVVHPSRVFQEQVMGQSQTSVVDNSMQSPSPTARNVSRRSSPGPNNSRPRYLKSRQSAHRLSNSSVTSTSTDTTGSDATLGADYALQSGGAVPGVSSNVSTRGPNILSRSISLGSMASGVSGYSDDQVFEKRHVSGTTDIGLQTLAEEELFSQSQLGPSQHEPAAEGTAPSTPKAGLRDTHALADILEAEGTRGTPLPARSFARQFREDNGIFSPDKRKGAQTPILARSSRSMTLKEQSSTIDRLSKENFDLKMRIHFLNEALNKRSEEGIKEMISENVELKSDKLKLQKENQSLKRKIRDLEKQLKERDRQSDRGSPINQDPEAFEEDYRSHAQDEEIIYLKERIDVYESEIEKLRSQDIARESEKRRLAEMVKSLSMNSAAGSEAGAREERSMWKDILETETAAREQAEDENRRLRSELLRMKAEMMTGMLAPKLDSRDYLGSAISRTPNSDGDAHRATAAGSSIASTLVEMECLKQENAELRRQVSAQTSMLTSRNREKERLYLEIEELKLGQRRDSNRSFAGDSILDRSASQAHVRPASRCSNGTGGTSKLSESEREDLEARNGQLRDHVSGLKLENQMLRERIDVYEEDFAAYGAEVSRLEEEAAKLQEQRDQAALDRDQAWENVQDRDLAYQELRAEAENELAAMSEELNHKAEECQQLNEDLRAQEDYMKILQAEMRSVREGIARVEEDAQNTLQELQNTQQELTAAHNEVESLEKNLHEANSEVQRLNVQIESSKNEIAFLREEQDGDKIKIGDLESELKICEMSLRSEKDKTRELEERLAEERHQLDVVASKEKQETQRMINDLNRETSFARDEIRRLRKNLSAQEIETKTWRERLTDLEDNLREALGDLNGSRSSLIANIMKLQKELESTSLELESVRSKLDEKESLLRNREALLESHGLESRKLSELLDRERQARRADTQSFEQALKSHHQASRAIAHNSSRISELEAARNQDRKRFNTLEQQYKEQLSERNALFLTIWKRLSTMCGPDWTHSNSLINGNLPSQEVIGSIAFWPGFSRNLLLAVKTLENVFSGFKNGIKAVERDLVKQYQTLEHSLGLKAKRLDRLDEAVKHIRAQQHHRSSSISSPEISKLRAENRLLKAELNLLQSSPRRSSAVPGGITAGSPGSPRLAVDSRADNEPASLIRHNSTSAADKGSASQSRPDRGLTPSSTAIPQPSHSAASPTMNSHDGALIQSMRSGQVQSDANNEKWIYRLHELERRLKAEREARLLDRSGARKRLEERDAENRRLRAQLERERVRKDIATEAAANTEISRAGRVQKVSRVPSSDPSLESERHTSATGDDPRADEEPSSSEGEGIVVDIEM